MDNGAYASKGSGKGKVRGGKMLVLRIWNFGLHGEQSLRYRSLFFNLFFF